MTFSPDLAYRSVAAVCLLFFLVGCGGQTAPPTAGVDDEQAAATTSPAELKSRLNEIAETGEGGSALLGLRASIEEASLDDADREALLKDLDELEKTGDAGQIRSIAQRMADRL